MNPSRRDFLKYTAGSALVIASSDLVGELLARSPKGNPMTSSFKGLADIALAAAKSAGCSYADIRFTRSVTSGANANGGPDREAAGGFGGGGRGGGGGFGRGGGGSRRAGGRGAAGFGGRVVYGGGGGVSGGPGRTREEARPLTPPPAPAPHPAPTPHTTP